VISFDLRHRLNRKFFLSSLENKTKGAQAAVELIPGEGYRFRGTENKESANEKGVPMASCRWHQCGNHILK
jgi:hypothetical protein